MDIQSPKIRQELLNSGIYTTNWQVPTYQIQLWSGRQHKWAVIIPVINEGARLQQFLQRLQAERIAAVADIIIVDGGSTDGFLDLAALTCQEVRGVLLKTGPGKLSAQLRCGYAFALLQGYQGIITIDGNNKDDPQAIPQFIVSLQNGVDFVQASRFIPGGIAENTPRLRELAIRCLHAPLLSWFSGFHWTDTTQGFRGYSRRLLLDPQVAVFRDVFMRYELLVYLSYCAPRLGYRCQEIATARRYPPGAVPTKISTFRGNALLLASLFKACLGCYNPRC